MPYSNISELPASVKDKIKDEKKLRQFMHVINSSIEAGKDESTAFAYAWAAVKKNTPMDAIGDLPDNVRAKIPSKDGKEIFMNAYNSAYTHGADEFVCFARGWAMLAAMGYTADEQGEWRPILEQQEENMFKRFVEWIKKMNTKITIEVCDEEKEDSSETEMESEGDVEKSEDFSIEATITKIDDEQRLIYGWASIIEEDGKTVVDKQGDVIDVADLVTAAHDYMTESREAHEMHEGVKKGETVESIIFTKEVQAALGIDLKKVGWFICQKISDDKTWEAIKAGDIKSFSIGGSGKRVAIE